MRAFALLLALALPASALAFDANGVALGGNEAQVKKQFPSIHCKAMEWKSDAADRRCDDARIPFGGIEARITFYLRKDEIQAFDVRFDGKDVDKLVAQLKKSYGAPATEVREVLNRREKESREVYRVLWERGRDRALLVSMKDRRRVTLTASRGNFETEIYRVK